MMFSGTHPPQSRHTSDWMQLLIQPDSWRATLLQDAWKELVGKWSRKHVACCDKLEGDKIEGADHVVLCAVFMDLIQHRSVSTCAKLYACDQTRTGGTQPILSWASHMHAMDGHVNKALFRKTMLWSTVFSGCSRHSKRTPCTGFSNSMFCRCSSWNDSLSPCSLVSKQSHWWNKKVTESKCVATLCKLKSWTGLSSIPCGAIVVLSTFSFALTTPVLRRLRYNVNGMRHEGNECKRYLLNEHLLTLTTWKWNSKALGYMQLCSLTTFSGVRHSQHETQIAVVNKYDSEFKHCTQLRTSPGQNWNEKALWWILNNFKAWVLSVETITAQRRIKLWCLFQFFV